jgi:hypothetical protein
MFVKKPGLPGFFFLRGRLVPRVAMREIPPRRIFTDRMQQAGLTNATQRA